MLSNKEKFIFTSELALAISNGLQIEEGLKMAGTKVLMKAGRKIPYVKQVIKEQNLNLTMVENCGMENETIYHSAEEIPDEASYYSLFIVKEKK